MEPASWEIEDPPELRGVLNPCGMIMDYLRFPYRTKAILHPDFPPVTIRWYLVPPTHRVFTRRHKFGSLIYRFYPVQPGSMRGFDPAWPPLVQGVGEHQVDREPCRSWNPGYRGQCFTGKAEWYSDGVPLEVLHNPASVVVPDCCRGIPSEGGIEIGRTPDTSKGVEVGYRPVYQVGGVEVAPRGTLAGVPWFPGGVEVGGLHEVAGVRKVTGGVEVGGLATVGGRRVQLGAVEVGGLSLLGVRRGLGGVEVGGVLGVQGGVEVGALVAGQGVVEVGGFALVGGVPVSVGGVEVGGRGTLAGVPVVVEGVEVGGVGLEPGVGLGRGGVEVGGEGLPGALVLADGGVEVGGLSQLSLRVQSLGGVEVGLPGPTATTDGGFAGGVEVTGCGTLTLTVRSEGGVEVGADLLYGRFVRSEGGVEVAGDHQMGEDDVITGAVVPTALPPGANPTGYLYCDGQAVSRTEFAALFAAIGTTYGVGDNATTFNVPDLRGRMPLGASPGGVGIGRPSAVAVGQVGGTETVTLTTAQIPSHSHLFGASAPEVRFMLNDSAGGRNDTAGTRSVFVRTATDVTGGGGSHENMPPWQGVTWWIKT